jgi:hypothetical protein
VTTLDEVWETVRGAREDGPEALAGGFVVDAGRAGCGEEVEQL